MAGELKMRELEDRKLRVALEYYGCDDLPRLRIYVEGKASIVSEPSVLHYDDDGFSVDLAMADAVRDLRNALARFGIVGRLVFPDEDCWLEGEDGAEVLRAIESLPPEDLKVSWEDVVRTQDAAPDRERDPILKLMKVEALRRGLNKEEREKATIGELLLGNDQPESPADQKGAE